MPRKKPAAKTKSRKNSDRDPMHPARIVAELLEVAASNAMPRPRRSQPKKSQAGVSTIFQFHIALVGSQPVIWRRIQVHDCTLDKLHEHIQTSMGWTNSHLHQFKIRGKRYGDPELLEDDEIDDFGDGPCIDSTRTLISQILTPGATRQPINYEYDFGDGWDHEILFEGCTEPEPRKKYPLCLEGERACPPEDVGGLGGYEEFLAAIADPRHAQHAETLQWSGPFAPEQFSPAQATKAMRKGLPDWREDDDFLI